MNEASYFSRPPIGFVVEGKGEYYGYPSIVSKVIDQSGVNFPRINAGGYGGIYRHLEEHLADLVLAHKPVSAIITIDLIDMINDGIVDTCSELHDLLKESLNKWIEASHLLPKYQPFPEQFAVVIQIQKFESWIIADKYNLRDNGLIKIPADGEEPWANVDTEVANPHRWFYEASSSGLDLKRPTTCKDVIGCIDVNVVKDVSPSFDKFYREVRRCYSHWESRCQASGKGT